MKRWRLAVREWAVRVKNVDLRPSHAAACGCVRSASRKIEAWCGQRRATAPTLLEGAHVHVRAPLGLARPHGLFFLDPCFWALNPCDGSTVNCAENFGRQQTDHVVVGTSVFFLEHFFIGGNTPALSGLVALSSCEGWSYQFRGDGVGAPRASPTWRPNVQSWPMAQNFRLVEVFAYVECSHKPRPPQSQRAIWM